MGGGGLIELFVTAASLVGVLRVISRLDRVEEEEEESKSSSSNSKPKITFDLPTTTTNPEQAATMTPIKPTAGSNNLDVSSQHVETPSWIDRDASSLLNTTTGDDNNNNNTTIAEFDEHEKLLVVKPTPTPAVVAVAAPPRASAVIAPSQLRAQLQPIPAWMAAAPTPAAASSTTSQLVNNKNPSRLGSPSWMTKN